MRQLRNVTVTVEDEVAAWARIKAAKEDTSVSKLIGDLLRREMAEEEGYEASRRAFLDEERGPLKRSGAYPKRDDLHERRVR